MSDLISRQAAIDMFQNMAYDDWNQGVSTSWADAFSECAEMIRDLPSAQPEVIRCKDCKYQRKGQNECEEWNLCGYRPWQYTPITDEHFCSYAERRTDE